jgi:hypothetical protein
MATTTVTGKVTDPAGAPLAGVPVAAVLVAPQGAYLADDTAELVSRAETTTAADGTWSLALTPNTAIEPAGTGYEVTRRVKGRAQVNTISVPASGPVTFPSIVVDAAVVGGMAAGGVLAGRYPNPTFADPDLAALAGLGDGYPRRSGGSWAARTASEFRGDIGAAGTLVDLDDVTTSNAQVDQVPTATAVSGGTPTAFALRGPYRPVFTPEQFGAVGDGATDDYAAINAAINAAYNARGGTVFFGPKTYRCNSVIVVPNDGSTAKATPGQSTITLLGSGSGWAGLYLARGSDTPATVLDLRGSSADGLLQTHGTGYLEISGVQFANGGSTANTSPFVKTTNTTVNIHDCAFFGARSLTGSACVQDGIILGGTTRSYGSGADFAFGGYGSVVRRNFFSSIRTAVRCNVWAESNVIDYNMISTECGGTAAIILDTTSTPGTMTTDVPHLSGNILSSNRIAITNYTYGVLAKGNVRRTMAFGNTFWDNSLSTCLAAYRTDTVSGDAAGGQFTIFGAYNEAPALLSDPVGQSAAYNVDNNYGTTFWNGAATFHANVAIDSGGQLSVTNTAVSAVLAGVGGGSGVGYFQFANAGNPTTRTVLRAIDSSSATQATIDPTGTAAVSVGVGKVIKTGNGVTGSRPAASIGAGSVWYDTTLSKPIWSDGTVWRDSAGTAV